MAPKMLLKNTIANGTTAEQELWALVAPLAKLGYFQIEADSFCNLMCYSYCYLLVIFIAVTVLIT
jgi:hypothetical protein